MVSPGCAFADQIFPGGEDALLGRIRIDEAHHFLGAGAGRAIWRRPAASFTAPSRSLPVADIVVDADHEAVKLGRACWRGHGKEEQGSERGREAPAPRPAFAPLNTCERLVNRYSEPSGAGRSRIGGFAAALLGTLLLVVLFLAGAFFFFGTASGSGGSAFR